MYLCVRVSLYRHGMAAEAHLRGLFHRFLCFSSQDLYLLRELGNRVSEMCVCVCVCVCHNMMIWHDPHV